MHKVGIIGFGRVVTDLHLPALRSLVTQRRVQVSQVYEPDEKQRLYAKTIFPAANCTDDLEQFLTGQIKGCLIASPPSFHANQSTQLALKGVHVLCEKPLVATTEEGQKLVHALGNETNHVAAAMIRRYFPAANSIRSLIESGALGEPLTVEIFEGGKFKWQVNSRRMIDPATAVGGVFYDVGAHVLDLLRYLVGPLALQGYHDNASGNLESECFASLTAPNATIRVTLSRLQAIRNEWIFRGSRGTISWKPFSHDSFHFFPNNTDTESGEFTCKTLSREITGGYQGQNFPPYPFPVYRMWEAFLKSMAGDYTNTVKVQDVLPSISLIEEAYQGRVQHV